MPTMTIALALHALAAAIWVGGMAFAYIILRPVAAAVLEGPERQRLWRGVFGRFFAVVWGAIVVLLASGYYMVLAVGGGFAGAGVHVHAMHALGLAMALIFAWVFCAPWRRFRRAVDARDPESAAAGLERIRRLVALNLVLGLIVVAIGASGRYWP